MLFNENKIFCYFLKLYTQISIWLIGDYYAPNIRKVVNLAMKLRLFGTHLLIIKCTSTEELEL